MKWEYKVFEFNQRSFFLAKIDPVELNKQLNALGREGWELVEGCPNAATSRNGFMAILKRAV